MTTSWTFLPLRLTLLVAAATLAACAGVPTAPGANTGGIDPSLLKESPECAAAKLKPADPLPASALPEDVLRKAQTGFVAMRYDVVRGRAENVVVVASNPPGVYERYAVAHARNYRDPGGGSAPGCIMTIHIRF